MKTLVFLFALCLGLHPALADAVPKPAKAAAAKAAPEKTVHAKPKIIDLDFSGDDEAAPASKPPAKIASDSHPWVYWTMGATVIAAAAGGVGWYWHKEQSKTPTVVRSEQVFTDDRQ